MWIRISLLIMTAFLVSCQNGLMTSSTNNSSGTTPIIPGINSYAQLGCNRAIGSALRFQITTDPNASDYVFIKFTASPSAFASGGGQLVIVAGLDVNPTTGVGYVVYSNSTQMPISGFVPAGTALTEAILTTDNNNVAIDLASVTLHANVGPNTRVLRLQLVQGSSVVDNVNALIPSFTADPNVYGQTHSQTLLNIHPLLSYASLGWTDAQYVSQGNYLCTQQ